MKAFDGRCLHSEETRLRSERWVSNQSSNRVILICSSQTQTKWFLFEIIIWTNWPILKLRKFHSHTNNNDYFEKIVADRSRYADRFGRDHRKLTVNECTWHRFLLNFWPVLSGAICTNGYKSLKSVQIWFCVNGVFCLIQLKRFKIVSGNSIQHISEFWSNKSSRCQVGTESGGLGHGLGHGFVSHFIDVSGDPRKMFQDYWSVCGLKLFPTILEVMWNSNRFRINRVTIWPLLTSMYLISGAWNHWKNEPGVWAVCKNVVSWPFMTVHGIHNAHFCV